MTEVPAPPDVPKLDDDRAVDSALTGDGASTRPLFGDRLATPLFLTAFLVAVVAPAVLVALQRDQGAWILVLAGVAGMLLMRLADVESFALGPLSAKLRRQIAQAKEVTERAAVTTEQLRQLALAVATPALTALITLDSTEVNPQNNTRPKT